MLHTVVTRQVAHDSNHLNSKYPISVLHSQNHPPGELPVFYDIVNKPTSQKLLNAYWHLSPWGSSLQHNNLWCHP